MLTSHGGVASGSVDEGAKDRTNADTSTSEADSGSTSTLDLCGRHDGGANRLGDDTAGLHGIADHGRRKRVAGAIEQQAMAGNGLACRRDDGAWNASWRFIEK